MTYFFDTAQRALCARLGTCFALSPYASSFITASSFGFVRCPRAPAHATQLGARTTNAQLRLYNSNNSNFNFNFNFNFNSDQIRQ